MSFVEALVHLLSLTLFFLNFYDSLICIDSYEVTVLYEFERVFLRLLHHRCARNNCANGYHAFCLDIDDSLWSTTALVRCIELPGTSC